MSDFKLNREDKVARLKSAIADFRKQSWIKGEIQSPWNVVRFAETLIAEMEEDFEADRVAKLEAQVEAKRVKQEQARQAQKQNQKK